MVDVFQYGIQQTFLHVYEIILFRFNYFIRVLVLHGFVKSSSDVAIADINRCIPSTCPDVAHGRSRGHSVGVAVDLLLLVQNVQS